MITLHPETERISVTILSDDPALVRPVEGALPEEVLRDVGDLDFTDHTLDAVLESLPDQLVALRWSSEMPDGAEWQPAKGALIGDPSDLGADEPPGLDVEAVIEAYDRREAFEARHTEISEDPRFVGTTGSEDGTIILLFARDSIPEAAVEELAGYGVYEVRGAGIELTLDEVEWIRDTLADIFSVRGLDPDEIQLSFDLDQGAVAFIRLKEPGAEKSIRKAVKERLGKGVVELWFLDETWFE